jgi:hypothetical protein
MIAALICAAAAAPARAGETGAGAYIVKRDKGGVIAKYHKQALTMEAAARPVVIDGLCASACTAYLKNACATKKARIGFHRARLKPKASSRYSTAREKRLLVSMIGYLDNLLKSHYPPPVKSWIARKGGLPADDGILWLEGVEAQKVLGAC